MRKNLVIVMRLKPMNKENLTPSLSIMKPVIVKPYTNTHIAAQKIKTPVSQTDM